MTEKRKYTDVVIALETQMVYTNNHLQNIDAHLQRQNDKLESHGNRLTVLETSATKPVNLSKKQAVSLGSSMIVVGGFIAGVVQALGQLFGAW